MKKYSFSLQSLCLQQCKLEPRLILITNMKLHNNAYTLLFRTEIMIFVGTNIMHYYGIHVFFGANYMKLNENRHTFFRKMCQNTVNVGVV